MKQILLSILLLAGYNTHAASTSAYTDLTTSCKLIASSDDDPDAEIDYSMSVCPGRDGFDVRLDGGDARSWISLAKTGTEEIVAEYISMAGAQGFFPNIQGSKLEWRYRDGVLTALIVRVTGLDPHDEVNYRQLETLTVIRINNSDISKTCVLGVINAKQKKANEKARAIADNLSAKCE